MRYRQAFMHKPMHIHLLIDGNENWMIDQLNQYPSFNFYADRLTKTSNLSMFDQTKISCHFVKSCILLVCKYVSQSALKF